MATYNDYQSQIASEKLGLVQLEASQRLLGWTLDSGSVYTLSFSPSVIVSLSDSGTAYTAVGSAGAVTAGTYFHDRANQTIYLQASDSSNPNSRFLAVVFRIFLANHSVIAPNDLSSGFDVNWLPQVKAISGFGVEIDNRSNQLGIAIEGEGSLTLHNDKSFWQSRFDKLTFENQRVFIYSWNRSLPITESKLIFRGRIQEKQYSMNEVQFTLKDFLNELRADLELSNLGSVSGAKIPLNFARAKLRQVYGTVTGLRPQNIDQVLDTGYPLTGTLSSTGDNVTLAGSGTNFTKELRVGDRILIEDITTPFTIESVNSTTEIVITEALSQAQANGISGKTISVLPNLPKPYTNRIWKIAGHELREPVATITAVAGPNLFTVDTVTDFEAGNAIKVDTDLATVDTVIGSNIRVSGSLPSNPGVGSTITRLTVTTVKINQDELTQDRDYDYDAEDATLTLTESAEVNIAPVRVLTGTLTYTAGSATVTGSGTEFLTQLNINSYVPDPNLSFTTPTYVPVLEVVSDTEFTLVTDPGLGAPVVETDVKFKRPEFFDHPGDVLTLSTLGATEDGESTGTFIKTAPQVVKDVLTKAGLASVLDTGSFTTAQSLAPQKVGIVIPAQFNQRSSRSHRDIINDMNRSVFGSLIQTPDFLLKYIILRPNRASGISQFTEPDVLDFSVLTDNSDQVKEVVLNYLFQEYDPDTMEEGFSTVTSTSEIAEFLAQNERTFEVDAFLVEQADAQIHADRWSFLLEVGRAVIEFRTKLQGSRAEIGAKVDFDHRFLYERLASASTRKVAAIQVARKTISGTLVQIEDLSAALTRNGVWAPSGSPDFASSSEAQKLFSGYWTDSFGMIDNDADTAGINLWW